MTMETLMPLNDSLDYGKLDDTGGGDDEPDALLQPDDDAPNLLASAGPSGKKVVYFVRHAEALHNVKEKEAVQRSIDAGKSSKAETEAARKKVLAENPLLRDAPLSEGGLAQVRAEGDRLSALFGGSSSPSRPRAESTDSAGSGGALKLREAGGSGPIFQRPDVVLVSPLRRALMTASAMFASLDPPPKFVAVEALREKRTGLACDERSSVLELKQQFAHVDFTDVERLESVVGPVQAGEDNEKVRARGAHFLDGELPRVPGEYIAVVSHKGWLREMRKTLQARLEMGRLTADFDLESWDKELYGNAEVRVAAMRWQGGELCSVVNRSMDNALLLNAAAGMVGDGFEFALGPPSSGLSVFLAQRTTKVHFISVSDGVHNQALRRLSRRAASSSLTPGAAAAEAEAALVREDDRAIADHPLFDARLSTRGKKQAALLKSMLAKRPSGGRPFTAFETVVCSPLTRACEVASIVFGGSPGTYGGVVVPIPKIEALEECRNVYGRYACDARRDVTDLAQEFLDIDFSDLPLGPDPLHTDEREAPVAARDRSVRLLQRLASMPQRCIAVVAHGEFLQHLFGQFGDTLHEEDRAVLRRGAVNCELRSVVLCSHGPTAEGDEKDAPASTVRVPSCSSFASLGSFGVSLEGVEEEP